MDSKDSLLNSAEQIRYHSIIDGCQILQKPGITYTLEAYQEQKGIEKLYFAMPTKVDIKMKINPQMFHVFRTFIISLLKFLLTFRTYRPCSTIKCPHSASALAQQ